MKKSLFGLTGLLLLGLCIISCTEDLNVEKLTQSNGVDPVHLAMIESMGFSIEGIIEEDDSYVVEGDMVLMKADLDSIGPATRQKRWKHLITNGRESSIRVSTVALYNDKWKAALVEALTAWNHVPNCNVHFHFVGNWAGEVNVHVNNLIKGVADAALPSAGGFPGIQIRINTSFDGPDGICESHASKVAVMVHELGHILGLGHTNPDESGMSHIPGTPTIDWDSIMNQGSYSRPWGNGPGQQTFSRGDLAAIQAMYGTPIWSSEITGPDVCWPSLVPATYTLNLGTNLITDDLDVKWYAGFGIRESGTSFSFTPHVLSTGSVTLRAVANYGGVNYESRKVVTNSTPEVSGPDSPPVNTFVDYSVPSALPGGVVFNGWMVKGGTEGVDYLVSGGVSNFTLSIKFLTKKVYSPSARYTLPDGTIHNVRKTLDLLLSTPVVSADRTDITTDESVWFSVNNPQSGVTYEWENNGTVVEGENGPTLELSGGSIYLDSAIQAAPFVGALSVRCRAHRGTAVSNWSNSVVVGVHLPPRI